MFRNAFAAAALAAGMMVAGSASAAALVAHGSGTANGYYGPTLPENAVFDVPFEFTLTFDLDAAFIFVDPVPGQSIARGGSVYGGANLVTGTLTVGGVDYALSGALQSTALQTVDVVQIVAFGGGNEIRFGAQFASPDLPMDVTAPPSGDLCLIATCYGTEFHAGLYAGQLNGLTSLTITYDPNGGSGLFPVPEPSTWALMIAGFGGAGAMIRRRRAGLA